VDAAKPNAVKLTALETAVGREISAQGVKGFTIAGYHLFTQDVIYCGTTGDLITCAQGPVCSTAVCIVRCCTWAQHGARADCGAVRSNPACRGACLGVAATLWARVNTLQIAYVSAAPFWTGGLTGSSVQLCFVVHPWAANSTLCMRHAVMVYRLSKK
jgi:hypothetical protein